MHMHVMYSWYDCHTYLLQLCLLLVIHHSEVFLIVVEVSQRERPEQVGRDEPANMISGFTVITQLRNHTHSK